jgi:hypothetical protein
MYRFDAPDAHFDKLVSSLSDAQAEKFGKEPKNPK